MKSKKFTTLWVIVLLSVFTLWVCLFCLQTTYAIPTEEYDTQINVQDGENELVTPSTDTDDSLPEVGTETISENVRAYLQKIYGDDYEKYYNQILEHWGSVEKFLLNASENLPEEYRYKSTELATKVNAYIGVGADAILLLCVSVYIIYRAKKNKKLNADFTTLKACDNQIEVAQLALIESQKAQSAALQKLMPGEKFEGEVNELKESDKVLDSAAEEVKKIV